MQKFKNRSSQFVATRDQELSDEVSPNNKSKKGHQVTGDGTKQQKTTAGIVVHAPEEQSPMKGAGSPLRKFPSQALDNNKLGSIVLKKTPTGGTVGQASESASNRKRSQKEDLPPIEQSQAEDRSRRRGGSKHSR